MRIPVNDYIVPTSPNMLELMDAILNCRYNEILVSGPRECAKTYTIWQCLLTLHELIPNLQTRIARLEFSTMGALFTQLDTKILKYGLDDDRNPFEFKSRSKFEPFTHILFDNNSKMSFAGMDQGDKVLGGEFDIFWYNECQREENIDKWTKASGAMTDGRAGNWGQGRYLMIGDMNPTHKRQCFYVRAEDENKMKHFRIKHQDHPLFFDWASKKWLQKGLDVRNGLKEAHTEGTFEYMRMVDGEFCNAEGAVFPQFSYKKHVKPIERGEIPDTATWRVAVDFGNNSSVGYYAETPDYHIRFKEIVRQGDGINTTAEKMKALEKKYNIPEVQCIYADHEHNGRDVLSTDFGYHVIPTNKQISVKDGIDIVRQILVDKRLVFNANSLDDPDPQLNINCGADAMLALHYKTPEKMTGSKQDDLPDPKCFDHPTDEIRYYCVNAMYQVQLPSFLL